ncbi:hypothetical protein D3C76_404610 [compost metagenome]
MYSMSMTSKIVDIIRNHVTDYEVSISMAEGKENEANNLKNVRKSKSVDYQIRAAELLQNRYEGEASVSRRAANKLYDAFKDDFDSSERSEVDELMEKL